jgi:NTE family protein
MDTKARDGENKEGIPEPSGADLPGKVVLVLQGGGALGAYQGGVYQAMHEAAIEPDWVIGTSIGAINGSIIAGNKAADRLDRLRQFWELVAQRGPLDMTSLLPGVDNKLVDLSTVTQGIPNFFAPNPGAWFGLHAQLGVERAGFYSTEPLRETLLSLVDFAYLNQKHTRLTVGTVNVRRGQMRYFTNRDIDLALDHVMASAAFPPGFPAVRIDGESYWDGGICSNTPLEAVLDDYPRRSSVIFTVQLWPVRGPEPETLWAAMGRQRDIQYASRAETQLARQKQLHRLRHVIRELAKYIPEPERQSAAVKELLGWGCHTTMHVVELNAPPFGGADLTKDIDFTASGIQTRWRVGYEDTRRAIALAPWRGAMDPIEGIAVHDTAMAPA